MKSGTCSKCSSTDVLRIPGRIGPYGVGNNIPVRGQSPALVTRFVCGSCGFSEEWIVAPHHMKILRSSFGRSVTKKHEATEGPAEEP